MVLVVRRGFLSRRKNLRLTFIPRTTLFYRSDSNPVGHKIQRRPQNSCQTVKVKESTIFLQQTQRKVSHIFKVDRPRNTRQTANSESTLKIMSDRSKKESLWFCINRERERRKEKYHSATCEVKSSHHQQPVWIKGKCLDFILCQYRGHPPLGLVRDIRPKRYLTNKMWFAALYEVTRNSGGVPEVTTARKRN